MEHNDDMACQVMQLVIENHLQPIAKLDMLCSETDLEEMERFEEEEVEDLRNDESTNDASIELQLARYMRVSWANTAAVMWKDLMPSRPDLDGLSQSQLEEGVEYDVSGLHRGRGVHDYMRATSVTKALLGTNAIGRRRWARQAVQLLEGAAESMVKWSHRQTAVESGSAYQAWFASQHDIGMVNPLAIEMVNAAETQQMLSDLELAQSRLAILRASVWWDIESTHPHMPHQW